MPASGKPADAKDLDATDRLPALSEQTSSEVEDTGTHLFWLSDVEQIHSAVPPADAAATSVPASPAGDGPDPFEQTTVFHPDQVSALRSLDSGAVAQLQATLTETTSALEEALETLADREMTIAALRIELRDERHATSRAELALQRQRDEHAQLRTELEGHRTRSDQLTQTLTALGRERDASIAEAERLSQQAQDGLDEIQALRAQLTETREALDEQRAREAAESATGEQGMAENLQDLRAYITARGAKWRAMQQRLAEQQERLDELTRELAQRERQDVVYRGRLQAADAQIQRLREGPRPPEPHDDRPSDSAVPLARRSLVVIMGRTRMRYPLGAGVTTIGRTPSNDIQLSTQYISRQHAVLNCSAAGCALEDLGSRNGILVNGELVRRHQLRDGDEIVLGRTSMRYEEAPCEDPRGRTL